MPRRERFWPSGKRLYQSFSALRPWNDGQRPQAPCDGQDVISPDSEVFLRKTPGTNKTPDPFVSCDFQNTLVPADYYLATIGTIASDKPIVIAIFTNLLWKKAGNEASQKSLRRQSASSTGEIIHSVRACAYASRQSVKQCNSLDNFAFRLRFEPVRFAVQSA